MAYGESNGHITDDVMRLDMMILYIYAF